MALFKPVAELPKTEVLFSISTLRMIVFKDIREFLDCLATHECLGRIDEAKILKEQFLKARTSIGISENEWAILVTILNKLSVPTIGSNIITACNFDIFNYYYERLDNSSLYKNQELWLRMISILEDTKC